MAIASAIRAGAAFVEVFLKDDRLAKGLNAASAKLKAFAAGASALGSRLLGVGMAMAAPLGLGTKVFADFEQGMANVATVLDQPQKHMDRFRAGIQRLAVELGESTATLSKGLYEILQALFAPEDAIQILEASARAAKAGVSDTATAVDAITTILNSYSLSAAHAADVSDWMFQVAFRGKITFGELASQIGLVASTAAMAGVTLDELGAMIATLTRAGVQADHAITATNQVIMQFLKPTAESQALAASLGFELSSVTLKAEGLYGVFQRVASLPPDAIAKLFPDLRALRGVIPALARIGEFGEDLAAVQARAGSTSKAFAENSNTLAMRLAQAREAGLALMRAVGEGLAPTLERVAAWVKENHKAVTAWIQEHQGLIVAAAKAAVTAAVLGGALKALGAVAGIASALFKGLSLAVKAAGVAFSLIAAHPVVAALTAIAAVVGAVTVAMRGASAAAEEYYTIAGKMADAGDRRRAEQIGQMRRLQELANQEQLNSQQMQEARSLVQDLSDAYGNLGIWVDQATGKIHGMAQAWQTLGEKMRNTALFEQEAVLNELRIQFERASREARSADVWTVWDWEGEKRTKALEDMEIISGKVAVAQARIAALKKGILDANALAGGKAVPGVPAGGGGFAGAGLGGAAPPASKEALYLKTNQALLDDIRQLGLQRIQNALDREVELTKLAYEKKVRAAKEAGQDVALVEKALQAELLAIRIKHAQQERDLWWEIREAQIEAAKTGTDRQRELLNLQLTRRREELKRAGISDRTIQAGEQAARDKAAKEQVDRDRDVMEEALRLRVETQLTGERKERALLELRLRQRRRQLEEQGVSAAAIDKLMEAERAKFELDARERAVQGRGGVEIAGSFSAMAIGRIGPSGAAERTARATEQTARNTEKIERGIREGRPRFAP